MPRTKTRSMTRIRFHCGTCGVPVTRLLRFCSDPQPVAFDNRGLFTSLMASGYYARSQPPTYPEPAWGLVTVPDSGLQLGEPDGPHDYGCCGLVGHSGRNRTCRNGHLVGTECSECALLNFLAFAPADVSVSDGTAFAFPPKELSPAWATDTAIRIARAIDNAGAFGNLPALADALEEAGCDDGIVLRHLRDPGRHRGGCWFVDQLLGKR